MKIFLAMYVFVIVITVSILGIPGSKFSKPPLRIFDDMEDQPRFNPQGEARGPLFENRMMDRPVVPGVVSRGRELGEVFDPEFQGKYAFSDAYNTGRTSDGEYATGFPLEMTNELMQRGRERYTIFCTQCHGATGSGNGIVTQYGVVGVPDFHLSRFKEMPEGQIWETITHGYGQMGPYGDKLSVEDRWAVIAYMRALQKAFNATVDDVPAAERTRLGL